MSNRQTTSSSSERRPPRVLFFGMRCSFSIPPLEALLAAGVEIPAIVLPGRYDGFSRGAPVHALPMAGASARTIDQVAAAAGIPVLSLRGLRSPAQLGLIREIEADVFAVACFPWKLSAAVRAMATHGSLNLHPSLLPRWRGPEPLFWTFRTGDRETGVTVHVMDDGFDSGPIVAQGRVPVPTLVDGAALELALAEQGGAMLANAILATLSGVAATRIQNDDEATFARTPTDEDLIVSTGLPATELANMVAGIAPLWGPLTLVSHLDGSSIPVRTVLGVDTDATPDRPIVPAEGRVVVACAHGSVTFAQIREGCA